MEGAAEAQPDPRIDPRRDGRWRRRRRPGSMEARHRGSHKDMLNSLTGLLDRLHATEVDTGLGSFGRLTACDGQLLEVSGLAVPIGTQCLVDHQTGTPVCAEVIGF